jgi:hypothetical protein
MAGFYQKSVRERHDSPPSGLDCARVMAGIQAAVFCCIYYYFEEIS